MNENDHICICMSLSNQRLEQEIFDQMDSMK